MFQRGHSLAIKQAPNRSLPNTELQLRFICYKLKLIDVITIPTSISISHE